MYRLHFIFEKTMCGYTWLFINVFVLKIKLISNAKLFISAGKILYRWNELKALATSGIAAA